MQMLFTKLENYKFYPILLELACALFLISLSVYKLNDTGLFDYDAVTNYQIISAVAHGDFSSIFHHASPLFYLFFVPFYWINNHYVFLEVFYAIFCTASIWLAIRLLLMCWTSRRAWGHQQGQRLYQVVGGDTNKGKEQQELLVRTPTTATIYYPFLLFLLVGSSSILVASSRYFSVDGLSFLFFVSALWFYLRMPLFSSTIISRDILESHPFHKKYWIIFSILLAITITINYKAVISLPVFLINEVLLDCKHWKQKLKISLLVALGFTLFFIVLAYVANLHPLLYFKTLFVQLFARNPNSELESTLLNTDILFYIYYFIDFESPVLFLGFITIIISVLKRRWHQSGGGDTARGVKLLSKPQRFIILLLGFYILIMTFLPKAPRGLLFIYPFLFGLSYFYLFERIKSGVFIILITILGLTINLYLLNQHIYRYAKTNYSQVVSTLKSNKIEALTTTVGKGIIPFTEEIKTYLIFNKKDSKSTSFVLVDSYWQVANIGAFHTLEGDTIATWKEPSLCSPYLFLEACEFNNRTYSEAISAWKEVEKEPYQLKLVKVK